MICIFCFYKKSSGVQAKLAFSKTFKHCNVITFDGRSWIAHEFDTQGLKLRTLTVTHGRALIRGLKCIDGITAIVTADVQERASIHWKPFIVRSCNEIDRYVTGINTGFTFNPRHLYNKLLTNNGSNYEILHHWRR